MFHRQIFYIVSLTKVGNDKWKNKRKDKFFNMVVTRGIPPLQRATRKARHPKSQTYDKKRAGNSMSCLPEIYIKRNLRGISVLFRNNSGVYYDYNVLGAQTFYRYFHEIGIANGYIGFCRYQTATAQCSTGKGVAFPCRERSIALRQYIDLESLSGCQQGMVGCYFYVLLVPIFLAGSHQDQQRKKYQYFFHCSLNIMVKLLNAGGVIPRPACINTSAGHLLCRHKMRLRL